MGWGESELTIRKAGEFTSQTGRLVQKYVSSKITICICNCICFRPVEGPAGMAMHYRVDVPYMRHLSICLSNFFQDAAADVNFYMHIHHTSAYIDK